MDGKSLERWIGLCVMAMLLAVQSTANLPLAADALPVAPVVKTTDSGQHPVLPGEKSPVESVRTDIGLVHTAPAADRDAWAAAVVLSSSPWGVVPTLQQAHVRLQI